MITAKHIDFDAHFEKKDEIKSEEIPQQTAEELLTNSEPRHN